MIFHDSGHCLSVSLLLPNLPCIFVIIQFQMGSSTSSGPRLSRIQRFSPYSHPNYSPKDIVCFDAMRGKNFRFDTFHKNMCTVTFQTQVAYELLRIYYVLVLNIKVSHKKGAIILPALQQLTLAVILCSILCPPMIYSIDHQSFHFSITLGKSIKSSLPIQPQQL